MIRTFAIFASVVGLLVAAPAETEARSLTSRSESIKIERVANVGRICPNLPANKNITAKVKVISHRVNHSTITIYSILSVRCF